jgi:hypothetical protein
VPGDDNDIGDEWYCSGEAPARQPLPETERPGPVTLQFVITFTEHQLIVKVCPTVLVMVLLPGAVQPLLDVAAPTLTVTLCGDDLTLPVVS